jgi:transcriptional regulator with XRE-family HTH domain
MMSPFSIELRRLRARFDLSQGDFAARLGYRQAYISALECGTKLPKDGELVRKIIGLLNLAPDDEAALWQAFAISQRFDFPPRGAPAAAYGLCAQLSEMLPTLSSEDVNTICRLMDTIRRAGKATAGDTKVARWTEKELSMPK